LQKLDGEYCFEWIVVDDGSTDDTKELVRKWQNEVDWPIRYIYQENRGKPWALQRGIKEVKGLLTLIADSDDRFLPETFEVFSKIIWNHDYTYTEEAV
jgi:glycosyltransferase involved in cell wall biosynthesis